ncbi:MAG: hypothetical protein WC381_05385 [Kiritimatiellia bacterium]|jgi:hypothetical protein
MWQQLALVLPLAIWGALCEMAPCLLFGFLTTGLPVRHHDGHPMISGIVNNVSGAMLPAAPAWAYLRRNEKWKMRNAG